MCQSKSTNFNDSKLLNERLVNLADLYLECDEKIARLEANGWGFPMVSLFSTFIAFDSLAEVIRHSEDENYDEALSLVNNIEALLQTASFHATITIASYYDNCYEEILTKWAGIDYSAFFSHDEIKNLNKAQHAWDTVLNSIDNKFISVNGDIIDEDDPSTDLLAIQVNSFVDSTFEERSHLLEQAERWLAASIARYDAANSAISVFKMAASQVNHRNQVLSAIIWTIDVALLIYSVVQAFL